MANKKMKKIKGKVTKRKLTNWESIEPLYRAGTLSNPEICRRYAKYHKHSQTWKQTVTEAAIRKQAKAKKWMPNLQIVIPFACFSSMMRDLQRAHGSRCKHCR